MKSGKGEKINEIDLITRTASCVCNTVSKPIFDYIFLR